MGYSPAFEAVCGWESLLAAARRAAKGKRSKATVCAFEYALADNLSQLRAELLNGSYQSSGYQRFTIHEPKRRIISAAPFRDRVVHHALCAMIEPRFERLFSPHSYANRLGKGTHAAIDRCRLCIKRYRYVLRLDVQQHFQRVDHAVLLRLLQRQVPEADLMALIALILASGDEGSVSRVLPGDDLLAAARPRGLPIGNLTSQFWSNVYLHPLDQYLDRESGCGAWLRYVDDLAIFSDDKDSLWHIKRELSSRLARLRLVFHPSAQVEPVVASVPWLGVVIGPKSSRVKARKVRHATRRMQANQRRVNEGDLDLAAFGRSIRAWRASVDHIETAPSLARTVFTRLR